jgi:hypothetical protein
MNAQRLLLIRLAQCWAIAAACLLASPAFTRAAEEPMPPSAEGLRWRRVHAPWDRLKDWPRGEQRYVPMDKADFERLIGIAAGLCGGPSETERSPIASAEYAARLAGDCLVEGEARLDLLPREQSPGAIVLEPCGLAIREATWAGPEPQPAQIALGPDGKLSIAAVRPGPLRCKWSLRGKRDSSGILEFALELPSCPANRLTLDLPANLTPVADHGLPIAEGPRGESARWRIELGGYHRVKLRLVSSDDLDPKRPANEVRQATTYEFTPRGVDVAAQLTLDVPLVPLRQLTLELDPKLEIVAATMASPSTKSDPAKLGWKKLPAAPGGKTRVALELPEPLQGQGRVIRVSAIAPVELGKRWRLPALRGEGLFWQEGTATLVTPSPLAIEHLVAIDGRQTKTSPLASPRTGESVEVQFYSTDGGVELVLSKPNAALEVDSGTSLELSGVEMTARVLAQLRVAEGDRFGIEAEVARLWTVQAVETVPADALDDWNFEEGRGSGKLTVRLSRAATAARPVRLLIRGRYVQSPLGRALGMEDLVPIRFLSARVGRRIVSLRAAQSCRLRLSGDERLRRIDPQGASPRDLELLSIAPQAVVFEHDAGASSLRAVLTPLEPGYAAAIRVEAAVREGSLVESYQVRCVPEGGAVDRLRVEFSHAREVPLRWTSADDEPVAARRLPPSGGAGPEGESWEIPLVPPRSTPFEFRSRPPSPWVWRKHPRRARSGARPSSRFPQPAACESRTTGSLPLPRKRPRPSATADSRRRSATTPPAMPRRWSKGPSCSFRAAKRGCRGPGCGAGNSNRASSWAGWGTTWPSTACKTTDGCGWRSFCRRR